EWIKQEIEQKPFFSNHCILRGNAGLDGGFLIGPKWTQIADWVLLECLYLVERYGGDDRTRTRGLCRDSRTQNRNLLKLNGTDGTQKRFWSSEITLLDSDRTHKNNGVNSWAKTSARDLHR